jgi:hypothetical protein
VQWGYSEKNDKYLNEDLVLYGIMNLMVLCSNEPAIGSITEPY